MSVLDKLRELMPRPEDSDFDMIVPLDPFMIELLMDEIFKDDDDR